jgi:hypothetical protein
MAHYVEWRTDWWMNVAKPRDVRAVMWKEHKNYHWPHKHGIPSGARNNAYQSQLFHVSAPKLLKKVLNRPSLRLSLAGGALVSLAQWWIVRDGVHAQIIVPQPVPQLTAPSIISQLGQSLHAEVATHSTQVNYSPLPACLPTDQPNLAVKLQTNSGGIPFEYRPGYHLSWLIYFVVFLGLSRWMLRQYLQIRGCIQKFPDWVDNEICAYNNKHSLWSNTKDYGGKIL